MKLDVLVTNLLASGIKLSDARMQNARILNLFHLTFIMIAPLLALLYFYIGAITLSRATAAAGGLMILSMALLRKTRNIPLCGNLAVFVAWAWLLAIVWNTGAISIEGMINPGLILNAGLILLAIYLGGYLWGTLWTVIVFLETGFIVYLYLTRFQFPSQIPIQLSAVYHLGTFLVALSVMVLFAFLFEREKEEALLREETKSHALRETNKYVDDILERSPIATFVIDRSHRVVQWNLACRKMTGIEAREILGQRVCESFWIDERGSLADMILEAPEGIQQSYKGSILAKTELGYELDIVLPNLQGGQRTIITAAPILDHRGMARGALQTLRQADPVQSGLEEEGWDRLHEAFFSPVFKVDSQGTITFWNRACEETFGLHSSDVKGKSAFELVSEKYRPRFREALINALQGNPIRDNALKYEKVEGKSVFAIARMHLVGGGNENNKECLVVNTDITDLTLLMNRVELFSGEKKKRSGSS